MIDTFERKTGFSAMQRTTGYPLAIAGRLLADRTIAERGALHQELAIPGERLLHELARLGVSITSSVDTESE